MEKRRSKKFRKILERPPMAGDDVELSAFQFRFWRNWRPLTKIWKNSLNFNVPAPNELKGYL